MTPDELQVKFAEVLRRELGMAGNAPAGAAVVNVAAPMVSVSPRVVAELPPLPQPLEVLDVARNTSAFEYQLIVARDPVSELMLTARLVPVARVEFERIV